MPAKQPDKDFATALAAAGLGLTFGVDNPTIATGLPLSPTEPGASQIQVWVWTHGGPAPEPYIGRDLSNHVTATYDPTIFVRVRGAADAWDAPLALARSIIAAMSFNQPAGYLSLTPDQSEPIPLPPDETNQTQFQMTFSLKYVA